MDLLVTFVNRDTLSKHITTSITNILAYKNEPDRQEKEIETVCRLLEILPQDLNVDSIPIADQLFDHLIERSLSTHQYRLLSLCLNLMKTEDRFVRINQILLIILDGEQATELRELLCKLLNNIDTTNPKLLSFDWKKFESALYYQNDPKYLTYVCRFLCKFDPSHIEEIFIRNFSKIENNDELLLLLLIDTRTTKFFINNQPFWYLIQRSLSNNSANNDRIRKCSLYLFKQVLTYDEYKQIEIKDVKHDRSLVLIDENTKQFWTDFIVIYEALEDGIVHLIKPLLIKFDRLLEFSLENGLSLTWVFILLQRLFSNKSFPLGRWSVRWFLNSIKISDCQTEDFFFDVFFDWLSNNFVFLRGDEIADSEAIEDCLVNYIERWFKSKDNPSLCLLKFVLHIPKVKWSQISLTRVLYSLRKYSVNQQNQSIINDEHLKILTTIILTQFHTYAPVLRLSAYSSLLDIVVHLSDWSISTNLLRFFSFFDRSIFLSKHFQTISNHFSFTTQQLQVLIDEFISSENSDSLIENRLFSFDNDLLQYRQIAFLLDLIDIHNRDGIKAIFNPLIENIRTAYQRPYISINNVRRSIQLFSGLIQENYFHSSNFIKDWLSSSIRIIVREGLNFIRIYAVQQPLVFHRLPIVFFLVGNHGDIIRFLNELINQIDTIIQQKVTNTIDIDESGNTWQSIFILLVYSIEWLMKNRSSDFDIEWNAKLRIHPLFTKIFPLLEQNHKDIPQVDMLMVKYLLVSNNVTSTGLINQLIDDLFKASPKELPCIFRALGVLLRQPQITNEEKCKLIENSINVINEIDHRIPTYWPCLTQLSQAVSTSITDATISITIANWLNEIIEKDGHVSGIVNVILESMIPIWLHEHGMQINYIEFLIECIVYGEIYQKNKKQQWQAEQLIEQDESVRLLISNAHLTPEYRYDRNVRVTMQLFLLHIWSSLVNVQQNDIVMKVIEQHRRLASKERRPRFCTNSLEHRIMFRSLQCLLCLTAVIKDPNLLKAIYDYVVETLIKENEPSLRLLAEWIIIRLISEDRNARLHDLYSYLHNAHQHRTGTICAWLSIGSHIINLMIDRIEQIEYITKMFHYVSPLLIHSNFHIRTFACTTMIKLLEFIERNQLENETFYEAYRCFKKNDEKSELGRHIIKLESLFIYQFDPIRDFSLQTIFHTLPKLCLIADDEYLSPDWFIELGQQLHLTFPISVYNVSTILQSCHAGIWRLTATGKTDLGSNPDDDNPSTIQHKANPYPTVEALDDMEIRNTLKRTQLIVVASLVDKQTNLGGLCRTGEVFGVKEMVIGSLRVLEDQQFLNLSMTAHKWLCIKQVQEKELKDYLIDMQAQGYAIVALEQTVNSKNLYEFQFPEKTLLLLGNEREGIRADLLSLVDATVEIPQAGVIRSLNVHVSGALCISEYARKYLNLIK